VTRPCSRSPAGTRPDPKNLGEPDRGGVRLLLPVSKRRVVAKKDLFGGACSSFSLLAA
jgi:hypothetical protein